MLSGVRLVRPKIGKTLAKFLKIWVFISIFCLKAFPNTAYALTSMDACAAQPECAAALGSELTPTVAAPTGTGFGASTLSTTTAIGTTGASVQAVGKVAVVSAVGGYAIWHYWNQANNEQAQNKAKERYCAANPGDLVCGFAWNVTGQGLANGRPNCQPSGVFYPRTLYATSISFSSSIFTEGPFQNCPKDIVVLDGQLSPNNFFAGDTGTTTKISDPPQWKDWPQQKRDAAVRLLNDSDWRGFITSMLQGGLLDPGDQINAPTIVIPGQETDDPNTPADERLLKKESGFFTFLGNPDFDKDGIPDTTDPDDDNDRVPDASDLDPHNSNVPSPPPGASGGSSGSGGSGGSGDPQDPGAEVTPEDLKEIQRIVDSHENLKCVECAQEIEDYLKGRNIRGKRIMLKTPRKTDNLMFDDSLPEGPYGPVAISENGYHEGVEISVNGQRRVFDNHHLDGVPYDEWKGNFMFDSKYRFGESLIDDSYNF